MLNTVYKLSRSVITKMRIIIEKKLSFRDIIIYEYDKHKGSLSPPDFAPCPMAPRRGKEARDASYVINVWSI